MRFTSETSSGGVREQHFILDDMPGDMPGDVPGVLWSPESAVGPRPVILMGHGGGRHKRAPDVVSRATRFVVENGFAAVAVDAPGHGDRPTDPELDRIATENGARIEAGAERAPLVAEFQARVARRTVPEWRSVLDAVQQLAYVGAGPAGYWGMCLGCGLGVPFVAAEPRVRAAVLGLGGALKNAAEAARITVPVELVLQWDDERVPREHGVALFDALASADKVMHVYPGGHDDTPRSEIDSTVRFFARHLA